MVTQEMSTPCGLVYSLVPARPLPHIDLSKSVRGELIPAKLHAVIHCFLAKYNTSLLLGNMTAMLLNVAVTAVNAPTGQILSVISLVLWLPLGLGALSTMRYDIVRLLLRTFDFWFFSCTTTLTALMISVYFWDFRFCRMIIDWIGFHNLVLIDGQVRGIRAFTFITVLGTPPLIFMLIWITLDRLDGCTKFSILSHNNKHGGFSLSGMDVIENGLTTLSLLIIKIVVRKRQALRLQQNSSMIKCVIYRCDLKFNQIDGPTAVLNPRTRSRNTSTGHRGISTFESTGSTTLEPTLVQQMKFIKYPQTFPSNHVVLPLRIHGSIAILLYATGTIGFILSFSVLVNGFNGAQRGVLLVQAWCAVVCTLAFMVPFAALYQRQLLRFLVTSFDFIFYAFQITMANLCVGKLYNWEYSRCLMLLTWWIWSQWALTLDALTPDMKDKCRFRVRFAAPVVALLLLGHIVIMSRLYFIGDQDLQDAIIFQGAVWERQLIIRAIPFYFSRVVTLSLWCPRLIWRLNTASKMEMTILRGSVCYNNYFAKRGKRRSRTGTASTGQEKKPQRICRRGRVEPVTLHNSRGPTIANALTAIQPQ